MSTYTLSKKAEIVKSEEPEVSVKKIWSAENSKLMLLLGVTFVSVYFTPPIFNKFVFLIFLILAYRSKEEDYFWLVWFFIVIDAPGRLFSAEGLYDKRIPLYSVTGGISFTFSQLFLFVYIAKMYFENRKFDFAFKEMFNYFFIIIGVFLLYSFLLGMGPGTIVIVLKSLLPWAWILIIPYYVRTPEQIAKVSQLVFPFVFIGIGFQIHTFITGNYLDYMLRGVKLDYINLVVEEGGKASRVWVSTFLMLYALTQALFYMVSKKKAFSSSNYLAAVVFTAFASIFLSATRGWLLAYGFLIMASVFLMSKSGKVKKLINLAIASVVMVYILQFSFPLVRHQFEAALDRFATMELLLSGDVTAGGTLKRIDVRGKRVMDQFYESPLIGWGFSDTYFAYEDGHVGQQNILLNVGIIGFLYLNFFYGYLCLKIWVYSGNKQIRSIWGNGFLVYLFSLLAIFIIHGSSTQFWGFIIEGMTTKITLISFIIASINAIIVHAIKGPAEENDASLKKV